MREKAPAGLGKSGRKLWKSVVDRYELRPDELQLLEDAGRTADIVDCLQAVIDAEGMTGTGSMGQAVVHPAVVEIRQQRNTYRQLVTRLDLPDASGETPGAAKRKAKASAAARARWASAG